MPLLTCKSFSFSVFSFKNLLLEFPVLPAHGALVLGLLGTQPLHDAVDVEAVAALTPHLVKYASQPLPYNTNQRAVIPSKFTIRTASIKSDPATSIDDSLRKVSQSNCISLQCGCFCMGAQSLFEMCLSWQAGRSTCKSHRCHHWQAISTQQLQTKTLFSSR